MTIYNSKSRKAEEFICHEEIEKTLKYAAENKDDTETMKKILERAKDFPTRKPRFCWNVRIRKYMKRYSDWRKR